MKKHLLLVTEVLSYCLIPNHFHMIVRIKPEEEVDAFIKNKNLPTPFNKQKQSEQTY
jgi:putative transposase